MRRPQGSLRRSPTPGSPTAPFLVLDGRGEAASHLAGVYRHGELTVLAAQELPHSLGYFYEEATAHLGFLRSSDESKVMALASYGRPGSLDARRAARHRHGRRRVPGAADPVGLTRARSQAGAPWNADHADLAASVQVRLEEVVLELARWCMTGPAGIAWPLPAVSGSTASPTPGCTPTAPSGGLGAARRG